MIFSEAGLEANMEADSVSIILELVLCQPQTWVDHLDLNTLAPEFLDLQASQPTLVYRQANRATQTQDQVLFIFNDKLLFVK